MPPLSWNEIKSRALAFSRDWAEESSERAEAQTFWNEFFAVFGLSRRRVAAFEDPVKKLGRRDGRIDLFWRGMLIAEHKSRGEDLDRAHRQALDYFPGIPERDLPRYVLVSDFARIRVHDLETGRESELKLAELHRHVKEFAFIAGYEVQEIRPQDPVNIKAAEKMGRLHDLLKASGYTGHPLEVFLVRLLFCLFADDTGIFQPSQAFRQWIEERTSPDGSDLGSQLALFFQVLNTPQDHRAKSLDDQLDAFPYVNGRLFNEALSIASFDGKMRDTLLDCCALDWGGISPAIFGALFQSIMDEGARRNLGAHYTSEENILKLIKPLFLDDLWAEFKRVRRNQGRLFDFHKKLRLLKFLDPACGCGNFLVIAYRELRKLELEILRSSAGLAIRSLDIQRLTMIDVDQFYGIEIEEFPSQIAQVALWLTDHQMNLRVSEEFGLYFARIPLTTSPNIVNGNALRLDWATILPPEECSYVLGNPPFSGAMVMGGFQRADMVEVFADLPGSGVLDYVACWYWKAAKYVQGTSIKVGFVSTSSITQGEQVGLLWAPLIQKLGMRIHFAHRTFRWSNEARGVAAVHCVIIGFARTEPANCTIFEYELLDAEPHAVPASRINPYLVDAPDVFLPNRDEPIGPVPKMRFGSMPRDGGHLILSPEERRDLLASEPQIEPFIRRYTGAEEFLNGGERYCLWLVDASPSLLSDSPKTRRRISAVRAFRLASKAAATRKFAATPSVFCQIAQPETDYLLIPRVSSERRPVIPIGFVGKETIANDQVLTVAGAELFHFGVISSAMHMAWARYVCGRLESRYRYSKDVVYNNFPWPGSPSEAQKSRIEEASREVLDERGKFPAATLADLYDPLSMPPALLKAHQALDRAVDAAYGRRSFSSDAERVAFLFEMYQKVTAPLAIPAAIPRRKRAPLRRRRGPS
jgi:hypothetical protein